MEGQVGFLIPGSTGYGYCSQAQPVTPANQWACANGSLATAATPGPSVNVFKNANGGASPIWDAMLHVLPWELYSRFGDTYGLRTAYDAMKLYLDVTMEKWRKAPDYTPASGSTDDEHTVTSFLGDWSFPTGAAADATRGREHQRQRHRGHQRGQHGLLRLPGQAHRRLGARARQDRRRGEVRRAATAASSATSTPASGTPPRATTSTRRTPRS